LWYCYLLCIVRLSSRKCGAVMRSLRICGLFRMLPGVLLWLGRNQFGADIVNPLMGSYKPLKSPKKRRPTLFCRCEKWELWGLWWCTTGSHAHSWLVGAALSYHLPNPDVCCHWTPCRGLPSRLHPTTHQKLIFYVSCIVFFI
jgi:hypothetical protein